MILESLNQSNPEPDCPGEATMEDLRAAVEADYDLDGILQTRHGRIASYPRDYMERMQAGGYESSRRSLLPFVVILIIVGAALAGAVYFIKQ